MKRWLISHRWLVIFLGTVVLHVIALAFVRFTDTGQGTGELDEESYQVLKLVDIEEYMPEPAGVPEDTTMVYNQPAASERIITTDDKVVEVIDPSKASGIAEPDYMPQHKISVVPDIPTQDVLRRIQYPSMALRQEIEGVVYLELYIDQTGLVRRILVLKDPGYGFAAAAVDAMTGLRCKPAMANGVPVAVRFRYPVRFAIQR